MVNYYELLGVSDGASESEILLKIKEKKRIWTQRQNAPKPEQQQEASNNLRIVPDMESTLLNVAKRNAYDQQLKNTPKEETNYDASKIKAEDLIQEGWRLLSVGNVPDALMVATKATEFQGSNPDAWALLGYCKSEWGEVDDAIYEYKRAIKLKPNDASYYFDLGGIYEGIEKWKDAMQQYQRAAQIDSNKVVYRAAMGSVYIKNEMYKEGIDLLEKCVQEESSNEGYKYLLAVAYTESTYQNWTYVSEGSDVNVKPGYYATQKSHVQEAEQYIVKAEKLGIGSEMAIHIQEVRKNIDEMNARKFYGNWLATGLWFAFGLFIMKTNFFPGLIFIAIPCFYIYASMMPQYKLNQKVILGQNPSGGFDGIIWVFLFYPVMAVWNFVKNYVME